MSFNSIPAFQGNYIWVLSNGDRYYLTVNPGETTPVLRAIAERNWVPEAILLTHHHQDYVGSVKELLQRYPQAMVYRPVETQDKGTTHIVEDGDIAFILGHEFRVIAIPSHILGHICYLSHSYLSCGDMPFPGDCGRLFEGTATQMY